MTEEEQVKALNALRGIASCATRCMCCELHQRIAEKFLEEIGERQPTMVPVRCIDCDE